MIRFKAFFKSLGCRGEIQIYSANQARATEVIGKAVDLIKAFNDKYTRYRPDSVTSQINAAAGKSAVQVDDETRNLLELANVLHRESNGLFDITSGVLRRAWSFHRNTVPSRSELERILPLIGWNKVEWKPPFFFLPLKGMEIDMGGFGKEYIVDKTAEFLISENISHGLINLGGDIRVLGPHPDGSPWEVGIAHPENPTTPCTTLPMTKGAIATSGDYERYFVKDGRRYSHLINPKTGMPAHGLRAATVIADRCLWAGATATVALLQPEQNGLNHLRRSTYNYLAITSDLKIETNAKRRVSVEKK